MEDRRKSLGVDLWLSHWGADFDEVMEHPATYGIVDTTDDAPVARFSTRDPTPVGDRHLLILS